MIKSTLSSRKLSLGIIALALLGVGAGWYVFSDSVAPGVLTELDAESLIQLKTEFNEAAENVRLIVLLSPT